MQRGSSCESDFREDCCLDSVEGPAGCCTALVSICTSRTRQLKFIWTIGIGSKQSVIQFERRTNLSVQRLESPVSGAEISDFRRMTLSFGALKSSN